MLGDEPTCPIAQNPYPFCQAWWRSSPSSLIIYDGEGTLPQFDLLDWLYIFTAFYSWWHRWVKTCAILSWSHVFRVRTSCTPKKTQKLIRHNLPVSGTMSKFVQQAHRICKKNVPNQSRFGTNGAFHRDRDPSSLLISHFLCANSLSRFIISNMLHHFQETCW